MLGIIEFGKYFKYFVITLPIYCLAEDVIWFLMGY